MNKLRKNLKKKNVMGAMTQWLAQIKGDSEPLSCFME